jgi:hypothetical protein
LLHLVLMLSFSLIVIAIEAVESAQSREVRPPPSTGFSTRSIIA